MSALPEPTTGTAQSIYALHARRSAAEVSRSYLGWSQLGEPCDRALWYSFRWAEREAFEGRIARLFDTGHREEARVLEELRAIGCEVWDKDEGGKQFQVSSLGGHLKGHCDAVVTGLPEAPKTPHLVDVKTIKSKKFDELLKKGMRALYPKYWVQAHGYMGHLGLDRAAFIFCCKDDDRLHVERFPFDQAEFDKFEARAAKIIRATEPPLRISEDPSWFECKYCSYHSICHAQAVPQVTCRSCAHSTPIVSGQKQDGPGTWECEKYSHTLTVPEQRTGCADHRFIPILLAKLGEPTGYDGGLVLYRMPDGTEFANGDPPDGFTSDEIRAADGPELLRDRQVRELREEFPQARLVAGAEARPATVFDDMDDDIPY